MRGQPARLSEEERVRIRELSRDISALCEPSGTTAADRKEIIRLLVERVVVWVRGDSEEVEATIHWRGGSASHHKVVRPVRRYEHLARKTGTLLILQASWAIRRTDGSPACVDHVII